MTPSDLHSQSDTELAQTLRAWLWTGAYPTELRSREDAEDFLIAAWRAGGVAFRRRVDAALGEIIAECALSSGRLTPDPALPLIMRFRARAAADPLWLFAKRLDHSDCGSNPVIAQHHMLLLNALSAAEGRTQGNPGAWGDQLDRVLTNGGSPKCARAIASRFAHIGMPERIIKRFTDLVSLVATESRPDRFVLLLRPFFLYARGEASAQVLGNACRTAAQDVRQAMQDAVQLITKDQSLAQAFARGAALPVALPAKERPRASDLLPGPAPPPSACDQEKHLPRSVAMWPDLVLVRA